jgi:hypothetical protein
MNKRQVIGVSVVAAVPAAILLALLVLGLLQGMLADDASVSIMLWVVWGIAALSCLVVSFLPFAIAFYSGLLPEPVAAGPALGDSVSDTTTSLPVQRSDTDEDQGEQEFDEATEDSEGEQLFEEGALEDFDDDFENTFDEDEDAGRKKRK